MFQNEYWIVGVCYGQTSIEFFQIQEVQPVSGGYNNVGSLLTLSTNQVINAIVQKMLVYTAIVNQSNQLVRGAQVVIHGHFLQTIPNNGVCDNLESLPRFVFTPEGRVQY